MTLGMLERSDGTYIAATVKVDETVSILIPEDGVLVARSAEDGR
ncbi:hypothetical protein ABGB14_24535 [Nonomuraea sp. B10E15]